MRGRIRVHVGQPHSTVDEGKGDMVMLYYPLFWWMMHVREGGYAFMWDNPILQWMMVRVMW